VKRILTALLLLGATTLAAQGKSPWKAGDQPPALLGLHLGDSRAKLDSVMGRADGSQTLGEGVVALSYSARHVTVTWARADGVATIDLRSRDAGEIGGLRVGDTIESLIQKWGQPDRGENNVGLYIFGPWAVVVRSDSTGQRIAMLTLGRVA
jgi:hypothetical protein